jgi:hypothetical protein
MDESILSCSLMLSLIYLKSRSSISVWLTLYLHALHSFIAPLLQQYLLDVDIIMVDHYLVRFLHGFIQVIIVYHHIGELPVVIHLLLVLLLSLLHCFPSQLLLWLFMLSQIYYNTSLCMMGLRFKLVSVHLQT